jgi:pimeloyl-ACP methyl ester carboxylesterase
LQGIPFSFEERFAPFLANRDFIMFDQRGTGFSKPSLACDEYTKLVYDTLDKNISVAESNRMSTDALLACHSRLQAQHVNFAAYNSVASAADLADLRQALGYKEWNLYGISYGTRLALTTMREHPEGIRSVILDSTVPLQSSETDTPVSAERGFAQLFTGCADNPDCNKAFPNLRDTFYKLVDQLDKKPITGEATNPLTGKKYTVLLNGASLISVVFQGMYSTSIIPQLPKAIAAAAAGIDYSLFIRLALNSAIENEYVSVGMFYTVRCNEEVSFETPAALQAAEDKFPQQHGVFDLSSYIPICGGWAAGNAPAVENQPVSSDIPTIVLSGQYDPITTPADGQTAAKTLSHSFFFEFPGLGHGVSIDDNCPRGITEAFLNDPTSKPNDSCIAKMSGPDFAGTGRAEKLVPLERKDLGFTGVVPEGWSEINTGIYARNKSGDIVIFELALKSTQADVLNRLVTAFKLEGSQKPTGQLQTTALNWTLYELTIQGQPADLALADGGDRTFVVMLVSDKTERQSLYDGVFVPAIKAFTPIK